MKPTATIRKYTLKITKGGDLMVIGYVYEDLQERWEDGTKIFICVEYMEDNFAITEIGIFELED